MQTIGTVLGLICLAFTGILGLLLLFVFPPVGIVLLLVAFVGWSSWAANIGVRAAGRTMRRIDQIERNTRHLP